MQNKGTIPKTTVYRKTSAEIIKEAQTSLATIASNGAKLVSTRRPITPNVNNRQLYGSASFANGNRPPSALNLKYLQYEMRALPSLEPINQTISSDNQVLDKKVSRSNSIHEMGKSTRLPALIEPKTQNSSSENLSEIMPLQKGTSLPQSRQNDEHILKRKQISLDNESHEVSNKKEDNTILLSKDRLIRSNDILVTSSLDTLLEMLKGYAGIKECSEEIQTHLLMILMELYSRIRGCKSNRATILGALYGLVECNSPKILLNVARIVLAIPDVSGSNLTGACKLVFKVARNEVNDTLFIDSDVVELLVDALGRVNPTMEGEPEAAIYGYGALRFLATTNLNTLSKKTENTDSKTIKVSKQKSITYRCIKRGLIQLMIVHLQILNEYGATKKLSGQPLHALYQLSGALRVISGSPVFAQIINMRHSRASSIDEEDTHLELAGKHLVRAAEICMDEVEVQTNIIRTLSILSEIESCCEYMAGDAGRLGILLISYNCTNLCSPEKALSAISRLGYILGNIHAKFDESRVEFFNNDAAMECLLNTLEFFSNQSFDMKNSNGDTVMDVLIKLIRVIANMSVNSEVGYGLSMRHPLGVVLLNVLLQAKEIRTDEALELTLAALAALHNLSYYQNAFDIRDTHQGSIIERVRDISLALLQILSNGPQHAKSEAARVLGNLTRNSTVRQVFCTSNGLKVLVKCLQQNEDIELMTSSCGVLVNLLGDWERRATFKELNGIKILREMLIRSAMNEDWLLCGMICQAFWNLLIDSSNVVETLGEKEADLLAGDLAEYLDEERIFKDTPVDALWEQFAHVAANLLERIQSCMSMTNSPINSSDDEAELAIGMPINNESWGGFANENEN